MNLLVHQVTNDISSILKSLECVPGLRKFIEDNAYLAGGAVRDMLRNKTPNDYDFFFRTKEAREQFATTFGKLMVGTPFENFEIHLEGKKFQFIMMYSGSPEEVVGRFDWNINMVWIDPTPGANPPYRMYYVNNVLEFNLNATHKFSALERLPHFLSDGYHIPPYELQKALIALTLEGPINNPNKVPKTFSASNNSIVSAVNAVQHHYLQNSKLNQMLSMGTNQNKGFDFL